MIDVKPGDLFAIPPTSWWTKLLCKIVGAKTFHWGVIVTRDGGSFIISESIGKGLAVTRLDYEKAYIYRIKELKKLSFRDVLRIHSLYGAYRYDWDVAFKTAAWWLLKHYLGIIIPRHHDKEVNCQEWVCLFSSELGVSIVPADAFPMCTNLENSPHLEYLGLLTG